MTNKNTEFGSLLDMLELIDDSTKYTQKVKELTERVQRAEKILVQAKEESGKAEERRTMAAKVLAQAEQKVAEAKEREIAVGELEEREARANAIVARGDAIRRGGEQLAGEQEALRRDREALAVERTEHDERLAQLKTLIGGLR